MFEIDAPWYRPEENLAFSSYAKHTQELDDIIRKIGEMGYVGTIICDDDMGPEDMRYIENEVYKRYGLSISIS
jgi:hypothetical protein